MEYITLKRCHNVAMPSIMMGTSLWDLYSKDPSKKQELLLRLEKAVKFSLNNNILGFDTAHDYFNESLLGDIFEEYYSQGHARKELFITTKVGNSQQINGNMEQALKMSLEQLKTDYIDLWLLHWPYPELYLRNWRQMWNLYEQGKVRAVGIANVRERHLKEIQKAGLPLPHVIQIEHHPFRTETKLLDFCKEYDLQVEAYSANACMLPFVKSNTTLKSLAKKHNKSITQIMMRWHYQHGVVPIFSSLTPEHILENVDINFELSQDEMNSLFDLDIDYKFHPESVCCLGY